MSEKYLVGGGNTFFITMSLKTSSLAPHTATFILGETCEWATFGVFWNEYFRAICTWEESEYMLREAGSGKKHAGGILRPSHSPGVCNQDRIFAYFRRQLVAYVQHMRGQS